MVESSAVDIERLASNRCREARLSALPLVFLATIAGGTERIAAVASSVCRQNQVRGLVGGGGYGHRRWRS